MLYYHCIFITSFNGYPWKLKPPINLLHDSIDLQRYGPSTFSWTRTRLRGGANAGDSPPGVCRAGEAADMLPLGTVIDHILVILLSRQSVYLLFVAAVPNGRKSWTPPITTSFVLVDMPEVCNERRHAVNLTSLRQQMPNQCSLTLGCTHFHITSLFARLSFVNSLLKFLIWFFLWLSSHIPPLSAFLLAFFPPFVALSTQSL